MWVAAKEVCWVRMYENPYKRRFLIECRYRNTNPNASRPLDEMVYHLQVQWGVWRKEEERKRRIGFDDMWFTLQAKRTNCVEASDKPTKSHQGHQPSKKIGHQSMRLVPVTALVAAFMGPAGRLAICAISL